MARYSEPIALKSFGVCEQLQTAISMEATNNDRNDIFIVCFDLTFLTCICVQMSNKRAE